MLDRLRAHPIGTPLAGAVLAGAVAVATSAAGLPDPYPLIVGLSVAIPVLNLTSSGGRFDVEAYEEARGSGGIAFDVLLSAVSAALIGSLVAAIALRSGASGFLLVIVASIATVLGGIGAFTFRNSSFFESP